MNWVRWSVFCTYIAAALKTKSKTCRVAEEKNMLTVGDLVKFLFPFCTKTKLSEGNIVHECWFLVMLYKWHEQNTENENFVMSGI